jgi:hypothetical protein
VLTTLLELFGICALAAFGWFVWPPACLLVLGVAAIALAWRLA